MGESWTDEARQVEVPLAGGDVTEGVVLAGGTVRPARRAAALTAP